MKRISKILALVLVLVIALSVISCGGKREFSEEFVLDKFDDIVRKISKHSSVYVTLYLRGMTAEEYAEVEQEIHHTIGEKAYKIEHLKTEKLNGFDDPADIYKVDYRVETTNGFHSIDIRVTYVNGEDYLYSIEVIK